MLSEEQVKNIKKQIISQIESSFPGDKKEFAIKRIESMTSDELEEFLEKNGLGVGGTGKGGSPQGAQQCVFCSIVSGDIESSKIAENEEAIAVLEINPISRGHVIIIPKVHAIGNEKNLSQGVKELIKDVSSTIKKKLKPKKIIATNANLFEHQTISLIPQYTDENAESKRYKATPEELSELYSLLAKETKKKKKVLVRKPKVIKITKDEKVWLPKRIP